MRLISGAISFCLTGMLAGAALATPPAQPLSNLYLFPQPDATSPATIAEIKKMLDDAVVKSQDHPFRTECSVVGWTCTPNSVFINAAQISTINVNEIPGPTKYLNVIITAGETDENGKRLIVRREFSATAIPDHFQIAVHKAREIRQTFGARSTPKANPSDPDDTRTEAAIFVEKESEKANSDNPAIGFVSLGRSEVLSIEVKMGSDAKTATTKTIKVTLNYQHWFVDTGGFITFGSVSDQELVTEDVAGSPGMLKILKKRYNSKLVPGTGIVMDFHPANYPGLAAQFGIATSVDRNASYYLGVGYRLRQLGPNALATFAAGIAATQVKRFPDVSIGDIRSSTSTAVTQGSNRYAFGPYLSLSLGFTFSSGTDQPPTSGSKPPGSP